LPALCKDEHIGLAKYGEGDKMTFGFTCECGGFNEKLDTDFALQVDTSGYAGDIDTVCVKFFCHFCQNWILVKKEVV
jgi:hypothetical protein